MNIPDLTGLDDNDHIKCLGDTEWRTVGELRTAVTSDHRRAIAAELRRRDDGFLGVVDVFDSSGTYTAAANGAVTTKRFTYEVVDGIVAITSPAFAKPQDAVTAAAAANPYTPPNPYAADLAKLRAANATPESRFEDDYKARRRRELGLRSEG